ncbi:MAG: type III pantothenate kinase [Bacteroidia bacterium]|nr:type III pantothenate kinase [Bacteroidia bacterium]
MDKVNLCIDIGNTSTKALVYKGDKELQYIKNLEIEKFEELVDQYNPTILVSKTGKFKELERKLKSTEILSHNTPIPIKMDYKTPETLGRDRIASAVGAWSMDKDANWLVIDLGTCLTMDLVVNNEFLGGLISPGVQMRFKAMDEFTAGLPLVKYNYSVIFPGKSTEESMQVGVCQSIMNEIEGYIYKLNKQFPALKIVDCSSMTLHFDKEVKNEIFARPKLVLEGLNKIINYNAK